LAGSVHGVVVQITAKAGPRRWLEAEGPRQLLGVILMHREGTSMAGEVLSSYSTSASASAEPQSRHQLTGFRPW
jgi:hypothetical protein